MQKLITKYGLAAHLAFLAVAPLFLSPVCVLWLSLLGATWLVMEPSRRGGEMLHDARRRVMGTMLRDPLFWVQLTLVAFSGLRCLNDGVAMAYDAESASWFLREPAVPWFPGSTTVAGVSEFSVAVVLLVVVMGGRLALGKSARQAFFVLLSSFTGGLGLVLAYLHYDGLSLVRSLSVFELSTPMHMGMVFGLGFLVTVVSTMSAFELVWRRALFMLLIALAGNAAGLVIFAPVWTVAAFLSVAVVLFVFSFLYAKLTLSGNSEFKYLVCLGLGLVLAGVVAVGVVSEKPLLEKVESIRQGRFFTSDYQAARTAVSAVSKRVWKTHPWIGTGLGSFKDAIRFSATEADWKAIPSNQEKALNGYWQLLVERGIVGAFAACSLLLILLFSYFRSLVLGVRHHLPSPAAWLGVFALGTVLVLMAADCSVFYPGVGVLVAAILAISANSFPKEKAHG